MPRSRNIKPGIIRNEEFAELHPLVRIAFMHSWMLADFKGVIRYTPKSFKLNILPYDDIDPDFVIESLARAGLYRVYTRSGATYIKIITFEIHQNPHKKEIAAGSNLPDFDETCEELTPETFRLQRDTERPGTDPVLTGNKPAPAVLIPDSGFLIPEEDLRGGVSAETQPANPQPRKKPAATKPVDERSSHPAIMMVREICQRYPTKDIWDRIIREIGDEPDQVFYTACFEQWRSVNGNPLNFEKWLFEPSKTGMVPEIYGSGKGNTGSHRGAPTNGHEKRIERTEEIIADSGRFERPQGI